jgi:hypothetical protein
MTTVNFDASVQYNDFTGTVAADNGDNTSAVQWLTDRSLIEEGEIVVGLKYSFWENHGKEIKDTVSLSIFLSSEGNLGALREKVDSGSALKVRRIETSMTLPEFSILFKRLEISLSLTKNRPNTGGLLDGKEIMYDD